MLALSFGGPRHGRILQANLDKSGTLQVRASRVYSFIKKADAPFDLFIRYYACEPEAVPDLEFYSDTEDAPVQTSEYVPLSSGLGKENIPPMEADDDVSSGETA